MVRMTKWSRLRNIPDVSVGPELAGDAAEHMRLLAACPRGWVELYVEQGRTPSTPDSAPEGYRDIHAVCIWGLGPGDVAELDQMIAELVGDGSALNNVPYGQFVAIARVEFDPGDPSVGLQPSVALDVGWGVGGAAVFSLPPPAPGAIRRWGDLPDGTLAVHLPHGERFPDDLDAFAGEVLLRATWSPDGGPTAVYLKHWSGGTPLQGREDDEARVIAVDVPPHTPMPAHLTEDQAIRLFASEVL